MPQGYRYISVRNIRHTDIFVLKNGHKREVLSRRTYYPFRRDLWSDAINIHDRPPRFAHHEAITIIKCTNGKSYTYDADSMIKVIRRSGRYYDEPGMEMPQ